VCCVAGDEAFSFLCKLLTFDFEKSLQTHYMHTHIRTLNDERSSIFVLRFGKALKIFIFRNSEESNKKPQWTWNTQERKRKLSIVPGFCLTCKSTEDPEQ